MVFPLSANRAAQHRCSGSRRARNLSPVVRLGAGRSPTAPSFNPRIIAPHRRLRSSNIAFARSLTSRLLAMNCRPDPKECIAGRMRKRRGGTKLIKRLWIKTLSRRWLG